MKRINTIAALTMMVISIMTGLMSCGGDDPNEEPTPQITINLRSCSITDGAEYKTSELTEVTLTYNNLVAVSSSANITLNGTRCAAASSSVTAMEVIVTLPTLEEGQSYTLIIPEGAIVGKNDATALAAAFTVSFTTKAAPQPVDNSATALAKRLGWGWNLGNHFDTSSGEDGKHPQWGYWDNATPTAALYTSLKAAGASTVRIGTTWGNYQNTTDWTIEADYMAEVRQNVLWAGAAGLNVILNMHHDEYWLDIKTAASNSAVNTTIKERITKTWTQIAEAFKDQGSYLFFETFNEVQDGGWGWGANRTDGGKQYATLNEWNQTAVDAIRATGGNNATRWIGVPGYASSPTFVLISEFQMPTDAASRLMVSVHFYDPSTFTLTPVANGKTEWGHTAAAGKYETGSNEDHVVDTFAQLYAKFIAQDIPVYIGEYGCVMHTTDRSNLFRNYYLEYVCRAAHEYSMPLCIWDNNVTGSGDEHHAYFNHSNGDYQSGMQTLVQTMIKAATSDDASYTLESVYNSAPQ